MTTYRCDRVRPNNGVVEVFLSRRASDGQDEHALLNLVHANHPEFEEGAQYEGGFQQSGEITLRFVEHAGLLHRTGIFNRLTHIAQYGFPYTHCDAVMPDGRYLGARLLGGVKFRDPGDDLSTMLLETFITLRATRTQADAFYAFLRDQVGKPYDPIQVLYFWGPFASRNWQDPNAWVCSELIAAALAACGLIPQHMAVAFCRITVQGLMLLASPLVSGGTDA